MPRIRVPLNSIISIKKIVTVFYYDFSPNYKFPGESHDFCELNYIVDGEVIIHHGNEAHVLKAGDMFCYKPNEFHDLMCDNVHSAKVFIVSFECNSAAIKYFQGKKITVPHSLRKYISEIHTEAKKCFKEISTLPLVPKKNAPIGSQQFLRCSLEMFFIRLMRLEEEQNEKKQVFFNSAEEFDASLSADIIKYLKDHLYDKITLEDVCRSFHFGKSHLCHIFKAKTGVSIKQYYLKLKLDEAKRLLRETELNISEISGKLCFESPQYFAKTFKKSNRISPTRFRNSAKFNVKS